MVCSSVTLCYAINLLIFRFLQPLQKTLHANISEFPILPRSPCTVHVSLQPMAVHCIFVAHATLGAPACVRGPVHPRFDKIHVQLAVLYCTVYLTTRGCLRLFRARTPETTYVDMTLGCARMWVAHTEFHT